MTPVTICGTWYLGATRFPPNMRVFRNPRGLQWYYAFVTSYDPDRLGLYKSENGVSWSYVAALETTLKTGSYALYDDGTQLIVYVVTGRILSELETRYIRYRRLRIADDQSTPTIGSPDTVAFGDGYSRPVIALDRNGYVHIGWMKFRYVRIKGVVYRFTEPFIRGSHNPYPPDNPSWWGETQIDVHPDIEFDSRFAKIDLAMFGGTGDIGGCVYSIRNNAGVPYIRGRDIVSWDGSSYTIGTISDITTVPDVVYFNWSYKVAYDDDDYAHLIYRSNVTNERLRHKKSSAVNTVESWDAYTIVDGSNLGVHPDSLTLSLNKSVTPNDLYAIYIFSASPQNRYVRWRKTPVDTISWGSESSVLDGADRIQYLSAGERDYLNALHVVYQNVITPPDNARYYEIPLVVPKEVKESTTVPLRFIKPVVIVKRNGEIIAYRTPYTPFRTERPIQPQVG